MNNLERTDEKKEKRIKQGAVLFVLLAATVFFYFAVIRNIFGGTIWDIGVYGVGAVLFAIILGIWIWETVEWFKWGSMGHGRWWY